MDHYRAIVGFLFPAIMLSGCMMPSTASQSTTPVYSAPVEVPFQKLIQPAFADEYGGKTVSFEANYMGPMATLLDLPPEYQQGYIRIMLMNGSAITQKVLVPKQYADATFALKVGQPVRVTAYAQLLTAYSVAGTQQDELLFIPDSITPLSGR